MPVNKPPLLCRSYIQWPLFFIQSTPNDPLFPLLYQILHTNCKFLCASHTFEKFNNFEAILTWNLQILAWNCIFAHWMTTPKKTQIVFWVPTPNDPLFSTKSYTERPLFSFSGRHLYISLSQMIWVPPPPRAPGADDMLLEQVDHLRWGRLRGYVGWAYPALHINMGPGYGFIPTYLLWPLLLLLLMSGLLLLWL